MLETQGSIIPTPQAMADLQALAGALLHSVNEIVIFLLCVSVHQVLKTQGSIIPTPQAMADLQALAGPC